MKNQKTRTPGWYQFCIDEIDQAIRSGKRLNEWEKAFLEIVRGRVKAGVGLTNGQESALQKLHQKKTEIKFIDRYR